MESVAVVVRRRGEMGLHVLDVEVVESLLLVGEEVVVEVLVGRQVVLEGVRVLGPALALALAERRVHVRVAHDVAGAAGRDL